MKRFLPPGLFALLLLAFLPGCSTQHYRRSADKEAYGVIKQKTPLVKNMDEHFTVEQTNALSLDGLPVATKVEEFLGPDGEAERGAHVISLETAMDIAVKHSRTYQNRKEDLYEQALGLTLDRHQFAPIFSASANGTYKTTTLQAVGAELDPNNPTNLIPVFNLVEEQSLSGDGRVAVSKLLGFGTRLTAAFTTDFFRFLTGDPRTMTSSQLGATLVQPLWRGAGYRVTLENLTQSERNLLYALRDFTLFRKRFSVDVGTAYYQALGSRDAVRNGFTKLQSARLNAERTRSLAEEGRATKADLGRLEQQLLSAENEWINAIRNYKQSLDNFKIQLGVSTDASIVLDDADLAQLKIFHPEIGVDDSIRVALATRLDYQNSREQYEDAGRKIDVAADALKAQVDLIASAGIDSEREKATRFAVPDIDRYHWNAGLGLDLPLDRKAQRNAYRRSLIAYEQSRRSFELRADEIKLQVRDSWRALDQAKRNFEISEIGVKLAERRVEEQNLLAELGRAKAQDQVDAQNDLVNSKNQRTQALVNHTIARLQFWNNLGILYIKDNGQWEEMTNAKAQ
ncbi:MAG TPA: TolC family protein [Haliangiales bacterium]|nr:TolC family protein [Haliangiales bacterium]